MKVFPERFRAFSRQWEDLGFFPRFSIVAFEICLLIHLISSSIGWNRMIDDFHSFRQCQTAISTYYTVKDGFHLAYETPVMGKPWPIPMEFPLFQWLVAGTVMALHTPLDQTGRSWSLLFFYLSLLPVYALLGYWVKEMEKKLFILCFILLNPIYLFWPRTFMIESLALFLGCLYILATAKTLLSPESWKARFFSTLLLGSLAALVKVTSWAVCCFPCSLIVLWALYHGFLKKAGLPGPRRSLVLGILILLVPLCAAIGWAHFTDQVKSLNPQADDFLTSNSRSQKDWIFGTLAQRVSLPEWGQIFDNPHFPDWRGGAYRGMAVFFLLAVLGLALPGRRWAKAACLGCFLLPLFFFTNLYFIHDYYFYANSLFFSIFIGLAFLALGEAAPHRPVRYLAVLPIALVLALSYESYLRYYHIFRAPRTNTELISRVVREHTDEGGVVLVYGFDWDSTIPYYSQRRALMDRSNLPLGDPRTQKSLAALGGDRIDGMLVYERMDPGFILERLRYFRLDPLPYALPGYLFFAKNRRP